MKQKDELIDALRERLGDLEAPVDPGLWAGIQARMAEAAVASGTDPVTELFREGLKDAEAPVDPGVWSNISNQLGHPAAAGTVSVGAWVGGGIAAAVVVGGMWWGLSTSEAPVEVAVQQPVVSEQVVLEPVAEEATAEVPVLNEVVPVKEVPVSNTVPNNAERATAQEVAEEPSVTEGPASITAPNTFPSISTEQSAPAQETTPPVVGPDFDKVREIMTQAEEAVINNPQPAEPNDPQLPLVPAETATEEAMEGSAPVKTEEMNLFIPNIFTPNNDGVNDRLEVSASGLSSIRVSIYSASNDQLMFRATDLSPWDGRDPSGVVCPEGYYFYAIEATGPDGKPVSKGTVVRLNTH